MPHSLNVITKQADLREYVALKHLIMIQGYITDVYNPVSAEYDPRDRTGSVYNSKDHEYRYGDVPDFQARILYADPQTDMFDHAVQMEVDYTNTAYTLKKSPVNLETGNPGQYRPKHADKYCPGEILQNAKLHVAYGTLDLSYFVKGINVLRNPNAKNAQDESLIRLDLVIHV